jgi:acyl-CoA thioesterase-2
VNLEELFDLAPHGPDVFVGDGHEYPWGGLFGGHIVAQALRAAAFTVSGDVLPHSLRAYFIRRGDNTKPVRYEVDRLRDGRSFTTRRVVARQQDGAILNLEASFQSVESSIDEQLVFPQVDLPTPDSLEESSWSTFLERRTIPSGVLTSNNRVGTGHVAAWLRAKDLPLGNELMNRCAIAYLSDDLPNESVIAGIPEITRASEEGRRFSASLDHTVWFHRPSVASQWHLYEMSCVNFNGARGLTMGNVFTQDGIHIATIAQETLVRIRPE